MGGFAEVLLEEHAPPRVVLVDGASERARATRAPDAAGGATLRASARDAPNAGRRRLLTWAITADDGAAIHLAETPTGGVGAPPARAVRVVFPNVLLPMACVVEPAAADHRAPACVVAIDVAGVAYRVRVPPPTSDRPDATFLSSIDATHVDVVDVSAALAPLEGPTAVAAVGTRVVAVGGVSGRVALLDASTLSLVAELKPPTLARLWNAVAGTGGGARAVRGLAMVPRATRDAPVLLAALRADCHFQIFDVTSPSRPAAALGVTLPAAAALFGGIDQSGGDGSGMSARAASAMHVAEGFLAVATHDAVAESGGAERASAEDASDERIQFPPPRASTVSVYALDCGMGTVPGTVPTVSFRATVRGSEGDVVAVRVRDGAVWTLGADGEIRGWPLDALDRTHPCTTLGDAARELGGWEHGREGVVGARGAVAALLSRGAGSVGGDATRDARAADLADDLAGEMAARGVLSGAILARALASLHAPARTGPPLAAAAAAIRFAAGGARASAADAVDAWASIAAAYAREWRAGRRPIGFVDAGGDALAVVHGACASVSVMRPLDATEAFVAAARVAADSTSCVDDAEIAAKGATKLSPVASRASRVVAAGEYLNRLLGAPACHAVDILASGGGGRRREEDGEDGEEGDAEWEDGDAEYADDPEYYADAEYASYASYYASSYASSAAFAIAAGEDWLDAAVAHAMGRTTPAPRGGLDDDARRRLSARRAAQRRAAGALRATTARLGGDVAAAAHEALDALEWREEETSTGEDGAIGPSGSAWSAVIKARCARQQTECRARAVRGVLLLLAATRSGRARVGANPAAADAAAAAIPRAVAALRACLLARWLAATPCAGASLAANIIFGGAPDADVAYEGAYVRAVEIGAELYAGGEMAALRDALRAARAPSPADAADPAPNAPALLFLAALAASADVAAERRTSNDAETTSNGETVSPATRRALGFFFRAATGLATGSASCSAATTDANGDAVFESSDPLLRHLIALLRGIMSGFPTAPRDASSSDGGPTRLEYYETLMLFFERLGCSAGAMECAHAALREVASEEARITAVVSDPENANRRDSNRRAARLWANLLQYALDLGRWGAAYAAVLSVPGAEAQTAALRRLVSALCEPGDARGGAAALISLPYGDRLPTVTRALEARAAAAPADAVPDPSAILYALRVSRGQPRAAAAAALAKARRSEEVVVAAAAAAELAGNAGRIGWGGGDPRSRVAAALEALIGALLTAVNALRLCAPDEREVGETEGAEANAGVGTGGRRGDDVDMDADDEENAGAGVDDVDMDTDDKENDGADMDTNDEENDGADINTVAPSPAATPAGANGSAFAAGSTFAAAKTPPHPKRRRRESSKKSTATLARLVREYTLAAARLELLVAGADVSALGLGANAPSPTAQIPNLVASLAKYGIFAGAATLATAWTEGETLTELVTVLAATLAARAALAQMRRGGEAETRESRLASGTSLGAAAGRAAASAATAAAMAAVDDATRRASADTSALGVGGLLGADPTRLDADVDPATAWAELRAFLDAHDVAARNFAPSEAAARAVLATGASIRLPQWLSARFVARRGGVGGMARRGANPTALLSAYLQYGRLEEAGRLALAELRAYRRVDAVARTKSAAAWFPEPMLAHTRDRMMEVAALENLRMALDDALEEHRRRAEEDSAKLAAAF